MSISHLAGSIKESSTLALNEKARILRTKGEPVIHLGAGENCLDLEKLLSHRNINERHLAAVRDWLEKRQR